MPRAPEPKGQGGPVKDSGLPDYAIPAKAKPWTSSLNPKGYVPGADWQHGGKPKASGSTKVGKKVGTGGKAKPVKAASNKSVRAAAAKRVAAKKPSGSSSSYKPGTGKGGGGGAGGKNKPGKSTPAKKTTPSKTTASNTDYNKQAKDAVAAELDPKLAAIKAEQEAYDKKAAEAQKTTRERGKQVSHDIKYLYDNLDQTLAAKNAETQTAYGTAQQTVDANYAALLQKITGNTTQSVEKVQAEAERLGLTPPVESRAEADGNFMSQLAEVNKTNAAIMVAAQKQNAANTGGFIQSAEKGLGVQTNADFTTQNERALTDMTNTQLEQDAKYGSQLSILEQQRASMEKQYMQQMEQQAYDRAQEAQQQAFMNQLAVSKFNLSADTLSANTAYRKAQLELERIKIQQAAAKATGSGTASQGFDLTGSTNYIRSQGGGSADALLQTFNTARTAGEVNFNDPKKRNEVIQVMRNWLSMNYPQLNTGPNMDLLTNALDKYYRTLVA